jgi:hypothetical protein
MSNVICFQSFKESRSIKKEVDFEKILLEAIEESMTSDTSNNKNNHIEDEVDYKRLVFDLF